jgi:hypothetical protein
LRHTADRRDHGDGDSVQSNSYCWLSVISTLYVCSANEPVHSQRVGLREWTGHSAEGQPPWMD